MEAVKNCEEVIKESMKLEWSFTSDNKVALGHDEQGLAVSIHKMYDLDSFTFKFHAWTYGPYQTAGLFDSMVEGMKSFGFSTEPTPEYFEAVAAERKNLGLEVN